MAGMGNENYGNTDMRYTKHNNTHYNQRIAPVSASRPRQVSNCAADIRRTAAESVKPLDPSRARARVKSRKKRFCFNINEQSNVRDFIFGFVIGIAVFGFAAVIVCSALFSMFS